MFLAEPRAVRLLLGQILLGSVAWRAGLVICDVTRFKLSIRLVCTLSFRQLGIVIYWISQSTHLVLELSKLVELANDGVFVAFGRLGTALRLHLLGAD